MNRTTAATIAFLVVCLSTLAALAGESETMDRFLSQARAATERSDLDLLTRLVSSQRLTTYEAVNDLLDGGDAKDRDLAESLAEIYRDRFGDDAALRRVRLLRGWQPEQHAIRKEVLELKARGKRLLIEGRFEESKNDFLEAVEMIEPLGDIRLQAESLHGVSAVQVNSGEASEGLESAERARELALRAGDRALLAFIDNSRAYALIDLGDAEGADAALSEALPISRELGNRGLEAAIVMMRGSISLDLGRTDEARERFEAAVEIGDEIGDAQIRAVAWHNVGIIHSNAGELDEAAAAYRRALDADRELGSPAAVADTALSLASLESSRGNWQQAQEWLDVATQAAAETDSQPLRARIELRKSSMAADQARYEEALAHLDLAAEAMKGLELSQLQFSIHHSRCVVQFYLGNYEEAVAEAEEGMKLAVAAKRPADEAMARMLLAFLSSTFGDFDVGLREIATAIDLFEKVGDVTRQGHAFNVLGYLRHRLGDYGNARVAHLRALELIDARVNPPQHAEVLLDLAYLELGRGPDTLPTALDYIRRAREVSGSENDPYRLHHAGLLEAEFMLRAGKPPMARRVLARLRKLDDQTRTAVYEWKFHHVDGKIHEAEGNRPAARESYRRAVEEVERLRSGVRAVPWKATLLEDRIEPYRALFRIFVAEGRIEDAYRVARMAKARTFVERLDHIGYEEVLDAPTELPEELLPAEVAPLRRLQAALRPGETLLDYFVEPDEIFVFVLSYNSFSMRRIELDADGLGALVESARYPGRPSSEDAAITMAFTKATARLGRKLMDPVGRELTGAEHVIVVPNAELHAVPFSALNLGNRRLVEDRRVSVLPAAEVLLDTRRTYDSSRGPILVVGDPEAGPGFERLPGAALEARHVARILGDAAELIVGKEARESVARQSARRASLLHIAAHARLDSVFPANSFIALTPGDGEDGRWRASEIAATKIPASLVMLSGCGTAREAGSRSARSPGDEREGLVRAFLAAGAGSIVANLWEVDDTVARTVIPEFYRRLGGTQPAEALAELQREMIRGALKDPDGIPLSHPFYWAGLVTYGAGLQSLDVAKDR